MTLQLVHQDGKPALEGRCTYLALHRRAAATFGGSGCFTFNSRCRSRSCLGSTVAGESVIKSVPFAVSGNANPNGIPSSSPWLRRRSYLGLPSPTFTNPNGVAAIRLRS